MLNYWCYLLPFKIPEENLLAETQIYKKKNAHLNISCFMFRTGNLISSIIWEIKFYYTHRCF